MSGTLKNINQLFRESLEIYRLKIKTLLGIIIFPIGFSFLSGLLMNFLSEISIKYSIWFSVIGAIFYLGSIFFWLWAIPSLLYNLKENSDIKESYKRGFKILGSYIWVYFLLTIIIAGGFLLFIVPGVLFSVWFSLAIFVLVFEERKGFNALFKSKHLVKGRFWGVLGRFLVLGLIIGLGLFLIFASVLFGIENKQTAKQITEVVGYFIQLLVFPFFLIYGFLIYNNLKEIKAGISYEEPAPSKKIKYVIPGILGILIVGLLISFSLLNIFWGRDEPPIDDSDLWLSKIEIPEQENAFYSLIQAAEKISLPQGKFELFTKMAEGEEWDAAFAKELIKNNEDVFGYFEKALNLPYFQIPEWQDPKVIEHEMNIPNISDFRDIAKLNSIKANHLFLEQGKEKEALDLILKTIKMGQIIEDSPRPILVGYLVGMSIKEIGLQRLRTMIPKLTLSSEMLKNYMAELDQFKANEDGLIKAMKMEYISFTNTKSKIDAAYLGKVSRQELEKLGMEETSSAIKASTQLNYLYKPNQTQKIFAEYYRNFIDNASKDCGKMKSLGAKPLASYSKIKMLFTENVVGKILRDIVASASSGLLDKKCLEDFSVIGTQTLLALKAYQIETNKIPNSLAELVPNYLPEIPKDPFGSTIKYSPEKKIIYSLGKDLKDSGGSSEEKSWKTMEDPTFKIGF